MSQPAFVVAAGAVVLRREDGVPEVLLVHRPKYDDWTIPKGKLDPGEDARTAAVREVLEETGVHVRLGPPLPDQTYEFRNGTGMRTKLVHYWVGRVRSGDGADYAPNEEIDEVRWVDVEKAAGLLTHERDHQTLADALQFARTTHPLLVVRHAQARPRKTWEGDDRERPLSDEGERQSARLVPTLEAYGVERLVSSSSRRCWTTLAPYGVAADLGVEVTDALSEEDATPERVTEEVEWLLEHPGPLALCSHRPVLPLVLDALGLEPTPLEVGGVVVLHHRQGRIAAIERIAPPPGQ
jgi:8-oxo-dGTP diphosphatase